MAGGHVGSDTAGLTRGNTAEGIRCGKGRQVRRRCRPAGQHGRLGQQQHDGHRRHDHQGQPCGQDRPRTALTTIVRSRPPPARGDRAAPFGIAHHPAARLRAESLRAAVPMLVPVPAVSLRVEARAVRVHGMDDPNGPGTRSVTVMLNHSPSAATDAAAEPPASVRTVRSTAAGSSPRASALAPALAPSSMRSCVIPAAAPASSMASNASTAGSATANSAVTAPVAFAPAGERVTAAPARCGSG